MRGKGHCGCHGLVVGVVVRGYCREGRAPVVARWRKRRAFEALARRRRCFCGERSPRSFLVLLLRCRTQRRARYTSTSIGTPSFNITTTCTQSLQTQQPCKTTERKPTLPGGQRRGRGCRETKLVLVCVEYLRGGWLVDVTTLSTTLVAIATCAWKRRERGDFFEVAEGKKREGERDGSRWATGAAAAAGGKGGRGGGGARRSALTSTQAAGPP